VVLIVKTGLLDPPDPLLAVLVSTLVLLVVTLSVSLKVNEPMMSLPDSTMVVVLVALSQAVMLSTTDPAEAVSAVLVSTLVSLVMPVSVSLSVYVPSTEFPVSKTDVVDVSVRVSLIVKTA
jgi:O-antigen ligase